MNSNQSTMAGKVCIVTGANTGIGKVTAKQLASQGAKVFLACRNESKAQAVIAEIQAEFSVDAEFLPLDLGDLESVRSAADKFLALKLPLHLLINNAGIAGSRGLTKDGFELTFGVNHLGPFLFTTLLLETLKSSAPARIVNVSSKAHYKAKAIDFSQQQKSTQSYTGLPEYECSKLANVLFTKELSRKLAGTGVTTYALHPGVVASDIWHRVPWGFRGLVKRFMITVEEGAQTSLHCATSTKISDESGFYYDSCAQKEPSKICHDEKLASQLWTRSLEWTSRTSH